MIYKVKYSVQILIAYLKNSKTRSDKGKTDHFDTDEFHNIAQNR